MLMLLFLRVGIYHEETMTMHMFRTCLHDLVAGLSRNYRSTTSLLPDHFFDDPVSFRLNGFLHQLVFCPIEINRTIYNSVKRFCIDAEGVLAPYNYISIFTWLQASHLIFNVQHFGRIQC